MKSLMTVKMPTGPANDAARRGQLGERIKAILAALKPEAAYFTTESGLRTAYLIVDLQDAAEIPKLAEPWFLEFEAEIDIRPVMTPEDLARAEPDIAAAAKAYA